MIFKKYIFLSVLNFLDVYRTEVVNKMLMSYLLNRMVNALCHTNQITSVLHFKFWDKQMRPLALRMHYFSKQALICWRTVTVIVMLWEL